MKIVIASDHAGLNLKAFLCDELALKGHQVSDFGAQPDDGSVNYPLYAQKVARAVAGGEFDCGILICGTGIGMAMAAGKIHGIRAANCTNETMARLTRAHNNANILTLGERIIGSALALAITENFLNTAFEGGRHQTRLDLIEEN